MIKRKIMLLILLIATLLSACAQNEGGYPLRRESGYTPGARNFYRDIGKIDFTGLAYTPWDAEAATASLERQPQRDYTIMIYMIGSDLESLEGAATADINEMLSSGVDADKVNVILFTGGTNMWQNNVIPANECVAWKIKDGHLVRLADIGLANMGDPGTLASFINFSMRNFPAQMYGLIFWDHAGGSIAGYGHDEKFDSSLTLLEMNYAFERSDLRHTKLEFMGFDACLMACVEMAVIAEPYANYLIASQDLEPGDGWDYAFLAELNRNPQMDGASLGKVIADYFMSFYGRNSADYLSLSVIDLDRAGYVMDAMDKLMAVCSRDLLRDRHGSFRALATRRSRTKTFGNGSPRDNECDMVDLYDMASKLSDLYPDEAGQLTRAIDSAVIYNRHNSDVSLGGLTTYYIFGGKEAAAPAIDIYVALEMSESYTEFLRNFAGILTGSDTRLGERRGYDGETVVDEDSCLSAHLTIWEALPGRLDYYSMVGISELDAPDLALPSRHLWPSIGGQFVCLYTVEKLPEKALYAIPALHNGRDVNIMVLRCDQYPDGKILGARQREGFIIQKGYDEIEQGDTIAFYQMVKYFGSRQEEHPHQWIEGPPQTVKDELKIELRSLPGGYYQSLMLTDICKDEHFAALAPALPEAAA